MTCPKCKGPVTVVKTVDVSFNEVYRKRRCTKCNHTFYTAEFEVAENPKFKKEWALYSFKAPNGYKGGR